MSVVSDVVASRELLWNLTLRELRTKYRRSLLGWTWSMLNPLATVAIYSFVFGVVFALNSSLHSYLILAYSDGDDVSVDVGFYYSANATGRLVGTLLSGALYLWGGLDLALWGSATFVAITWLLSFGLPPLPNGETNGRSEDGEHAAV